MSPPVFSSIPDPRSGGLALLAKKSCMTNKIIHWGIAILVFGIPFLMNSHSPVLDITVGGVLNAVYLWASHKFYPTTPVK